MTKEEFEEYGRKLSKAARFGKSRAVTGQMLNWLSYRENPTEFKPLVFELEKVSIDG